ncbi:hypothetical protein QQP08_017370 [Theobroma cacao]|nr:hypothetical protein QQP08_016674 [Theobroma cacao]WRX24883.1 hypothetical protein QQP08_017370 [Theobroma cacao]
MSEAVEVTDVDKCFIFVYIPVSFPLSEQNSSCYTEEGKEVQEEPKTETNATQAEFQHHPKSSSTFVLQCSLSEGAAGNSQPSESGIQQRNGVMEEMEDQLRVLKKKGTKMVSEILGKKKRWLSEIECTLPSSRSRLLVSLGPVAWIVGFVLA